MLEQPDTEERSRRSPSCRSSSRSPRRRARRWRRCGWPRRARKGARAGRRWRRGSAWRSFWERPRSAPSPWGHGVARWRQSRAQAANARERAAAPERRRRPRRRRCFSGTPPAGDRGAPGPPRSRPPSRRSPSRPRRIAAAPVAAPRRRRRSTAASPPKGATPRPDSGLWRRSPEACARAFAADPKNASLALAVAQAEHAHARLDEAAQWARRALALDPNAAEAYVIIARADAEDGRDEEARTAYRRYLEIAPRGWHKAEARAALRRASSRSTLTSPRRTKRISGDRARPSAGGADRRSSSARVSPPRAQLLYPRTTA